MTKRQILDAVRQICLGLPETSERLSHGAPTFFIRDKRSFATVWNNHHDDGRYALICAAPDGMQAILVEADRSASTSRRTSGTAAGSAFASTAASTATRSPESSRTPLPKCAAEARRGGGQRFWCGTTRFMTRTRRVPSGRSASARPR